MKISQNVKLSQFTSFGTGGISQNFVEIDTSDNLIEIIKTNLKPYWVLGMGTNSLISDDGLDGTTLHLKTDGIEIANNNTTIVDAGTNWDDFVSLITRKGFWGLELMSGIPGSVGGAIVGNIAAYGQDVSDTLQWVEVIDYSSTNPTVKKLTSDELKLDYRSSSFSTGAIKSRIIVRAAFKLFTSATTNLEYESALRIAKRNNLNTDKLVDRRMVILKARETAGSLLDNKHKQKTAGSFFKNPIVNKSLAEKLMTFEEHQVSRQAILKQNLIHGGNETRVSAAHVLLGAGFKRSQSWGPVRLHPDHILKIENTGDATSQQIYDVAQEIMQTTKHKLGINLVPEVKFIGKFK